MHLNNPDRLATLFASSPIIAVHLPGYFKVVHSESPSPIQPAVMQKKNFLFGALLSRRWLRLFLLLLFFYTATECFTIKIPHCVEEEEQADERGKENDHHYVISGVMQENGRGTEEAANTSVFIVLCFSFCDPFSGGF